MTYKAIYILPILLLTACEGDSDNNAPVTNIGPPTSVCENTIGNSSISGRLDFYDNIEFNQDDYIEVALEDSSIADSSSTNVGTKCIAIAGGETLPLEYQISYDRSLIQEGHSYTVRATYYQAVSDKGYEKSYITKQSYPVLTNGWTDTTDIFLEKI